MQNTIKRSRGIVPLVCAGVLCSVATVLPDTINGVVTDSATRFSVDQVMVTSEGVSTTTDANGVFHLALPSSALQSSHQSRHQRSLVWNPQDASIVWSGCGGDMSIQLQDTRGRVVGQFAWENSSGRLRFPIGHLSQGTFFVTIGTMGQADVYKILSVLPGRTSSSATTSHTLVGANAALARTVATSQPHDIVFSKSGYTTKTVPVPAGMQDSVGVLLGRSPEDAISGTVYYVSTAGDDDLNDGRSTTSPFRNPQKAHDIMVAGDTCKVMPGTYNYSGSGEYLVITRSGSAEGRIRYQAYDMSERPVIKLDLVGSGTGTYVGWGAIKVKGAKYIDISGFILVGANDDLDVAKGEEVRDYYMAEKAKDNGFADCDWQYVNTTNTNGISIDKDGTEYVHHLTISHCDISKFAGCGIGLGNADYAVIDNNLCYDNSWYTLWPTSGITVSTGYNSDSYTGFKTIVSNNVCFGNKAYVRWEYNGEYTDGNGIIADVNRSDLVNPVSPSETYNGKTLFVNNICYNNGGSGLHSYGAVNVWFVNNIAYKNATRGAEQGVYANMFANDSPDNRFINNISIAETGMKNFDQYLSSGTTWSNNLYSGGGTNQGISSGIEEQNPLFTGPFTDLAGDLRNGFRVGESSPCIDAGYAFPSYSTDIEGITRPLRTSWDIGAFELQ